MGDMSMGARGDLLSLPLSLLLTLLLNQMLTPTMPSMEAMEATMDLGATTEAMLPTMVDISMDAKGGLLSLLLTLKLTPTMPSMEATMDLEATMEAMRPTMEQDTSMGARGDLLSLLLSPQLILLLTPG